MATSAFKSTSRRGTDPSGGSSRRRSHSVSAPVARKTLSDDIFSNSRDNPLFWSENGKPHEIGSNGGTKQLDSLITSTRRSSGGGGEEEERGRSVTRNGGAKKGIGRSLSRVRAYESEKEQGVVKSTGVRSRTEIKQTSNGVNRSNPIRDRSKPRGGRAEEERTRKFENRATEWSEDDSTCSFPILNLEDEILSNFLSEVEEKTVTAVCEDLTPPREQWAGVMPLSGMYESSQSETIRRNNLHMSPATSIADIPVDLVNPGDMELISDIRREYAIKLEESEERARKLRTDLAVEEQRGQELGRILKEILPDPKIPSVLPRPRRGRKTSNERKRVSRRLTEEAIAYFDECVSLSTFDSSDFSAPEDPIFSSTGSTMRIGASALVKEIPNTLCRYEPYSTPEKQVQLHNSGENSGTIIDSNTTSEAGISYNFSFSNQQLKKVKPHGNFVNSYIKDFEIDIVKDTDPDCRKSYYDAEEYSAHDHVENMLIDRILYRNRIDSGSLLLCGGAISCLPFSSIL